MDFSRENESNKDILVTSYNLIIKRYRCRVKVWRNLEVREKIEINNKCYKT